MRAPYLLSVAFAAAMAVQAALGLAFAEQYRDAAWIRAAWSGNDGVTLLLAVPALIIALLRVRRDDVRGLLLWLGLLGYGVYNYAFYMLGTELNVFFPLYIVSFVLSAAALILALSRLDVGAVAARFEPGVPVRTIGGYYVFVAAGLTAAWMSMWAAYVVGGRPLPVEPHAFRLVAALDLALMVPALACGGVLLWRRHPWGYLLASLAGVQGTLYLLVLSVNAVRAVLGGLAQAPGEIPMWLPLTLATAAATMTLFVRVQRQGRGALPWRTDRPSHPRGRAGSPEIAPPI